jgi:nucleoside-diphosphate-sugar epimerase
VSEYGRSKLAGEIAAFEAADGAFPVTVVRPPVVYGPRDTGVLNFFRFADRGFRPRFTREKYYSIIHVRDLVRGMVLAAEAPQAAGRTWHLANPSAPSFTRLFEIIAELVGRPLRPLPLPTPLLPLIAGIVDTLSGSFGMDARPLSDKVREILPDLWVMDTSLAKSELGFRTEVGLEEGFAETARSYRELGWLPAPAPRV